ncbi:hypothetical protein RJT34_17371 [Clitoria ternatea]|uniref:Zinc finger CCCH domain-containing protein 62-like n=1 Tax=Clitoria ternatea TaxID=43366 RepID=A0AAN9PES7_CLITE
MATKDSALVLYEMSTDSVGSDWDDSEGDPDNDMLEETHINFSNLSLTKTAKARVVDVKGLGSSDTDPEVLQVTAPVVDEDKFEKGLLEKLKVDDCKLYLRKNGLRLTGNKDTLIQRIQEHLEIVNGGGENKYPPSSFVLNCKGDACTGDVVLFEQNVYEMFNLASRSASGPPCGKRIVAGRIVKESYGVAKQQHTFTIEVLWSKGEKPLPPLYPLLIKGRNLYRLQTLRQKWEDEAKRQKILTEKHLRGSVAKADREARIQEKEKRKTIKENRVSRKDLVRNLYQSHSSYTNVSTNLEKPEFPSKNSGLSAYIRNRSSAAVNKPVSGTERCLAMGSDHLASLGRTSFSGHQIHNQQVWMQPFVHGGGNFGIDHVRAVEHSADYNHAEAELYLRGKPTITGRTHQRVPSANANRESYRQNQLCRHYSRGMCYFGDNCKFLHDKGNV